jgi:hypothetical protein
MKRISDHRLYLFFGCAVFFLALLVAAPSFYSILSVEPRVESLLTSQDNVADSYKKAYVILRTPHIFGKYEHFDAEGISVKNSLMYFDRMIYAGQELSSVHRQYIEVVFDRRKKASRLGRYTVFFLGILSALSFLCFFIENKREGASTGA